MAIRTRVVVAVATGEASKTVGAAAGAVAVVTTAAVVAMNPEVVEVAVEAEAAWAEVTVVASINLVVSEQSFQNSQLPAMLCLIVHLQMF